MEAPSSCVTDMSSCVEQLQGPAAGQPDTGKAEECLRHDCTRPRSKPWDMALPREESLGMPQARPDFLPVSEASDTLLDQAAKSLWCLATCSSS